MRNALLPKYLLQPARIGDELAGPAGPDD